MVSDEIQLHENAKAICLTGGPCGGKTTLQAMLVDVFQNMGWKVFRVPETATVLLSGGVVFSELDEEQSYEFQKHFLQVMLSIEQTFLKLADTYARKGKKCVVICDRGAMDCSAYMDREEWLRLLKEIKKTEIQIRDARYHCVVHMASAADGAEKYYSSASNAVRLESTELARDLDKKVKNAWLGHPYFDLIDNSTPFVEKCNRAIHAILKRLGLRDKRFGSNISKHKFLINNFSMDATFPVEYRDFKVKHTFLASTGPNTQTRIRSRESDGAAHFSVTIRKPGLDGSFVETRMLLSRRQYEALKIQKDPHRRSIVKKRRCFIWNNVYFQLDFFESPCNGLCLMEAYYDDTTFDPQQLPTFVNVEMEVTGQTQYSMFTLSRKSLD